MQLSQPLCSMTWGHTSINQSCFSVGLHAWSKVVCELLCRLVPGSLLALLAWLLVEAVLRCIIHYSLLINGRLSRTLQHPGAAGPLHSALLSDYQRQQDSHVSKGSSHMNR
jgi:hypothetical protein